MSTKEQCVNYGRKNVYLEILEEWEKENGKN
jgi:hypothetical protein